MIKNKTSRTSYTYIRVSSCTGIPIMFKSVRNTNRQSLEWVCYCCVFSEFGRLKVSIKVGSADITHTFESVVNQTLLPGNGRGLRYVKLETVLRTSRFIPRTEVDNDLVLQCSAEVTGLPAVVEQIPLNIRCESPTPLIAMGISGVISAKPWGSTQPFLSTLEPSRPLPPRRYW